MAILAALAALALCGCRSAPPPVARPQAPPPRIDLAGQAVVRQVRGPYDVPVGPGAEGRAGDWVLENAFVRFVVAGVRPTRPGGEGGNLIDAAMQGGEDRMRLLVPELGDRPLLQPVYADVNVAAPGGQGAIATLVAEGHLPGQPKVNVTTTYSLAPGERMLEVRTRVQNNTNAMLPGFTLADRLCQGRTERYVPGPGLWPTGQRSSAHWEAFFGGGFVWGLLGPVLAPTEGVHEAGYSLLTYSSTDLAAGQEREYRRYLLAQFGGPEKVWLAADPVPDNQLCTIRVEPREEHGERPVPGGFVYVRPGGNRPEFVAPVDDTGVAEFEVPKGRYDLHVAAPGRASSGVRTLDMAAGASAVWPVPLSQPAAARLEVRGRIGGIVAPLTGRVTAFSLSAAGSMPGPGPAYPVQPPMGSVLISAGQQAHLPLPPAGPVLAGSYMLAASKGTLFDSAWARVNAAPGDQPKLSAVLDRIVDPGDYVAVDMCQHTDASPDCALTVPERLLADACEGLQAAVAVDPALPAAGLAVPVESECVLLNGLRLDRSGQGSFSVFPIDPGGPAAPEQLWEPGLSAAELLGRAAKQFPDALVQVNHPLDAETGYFTLGRFDRNTGKSALEGFGGEFDALELLSGDDVQGARDLLPYWFALLNAGKRVIITGGSDSVGFSGPQAALARTFVRCPTGGMRPTAEQVANAVRALKKAPDAFVSNGPFIIAMLNGRPMGSQQRVKDAKAVLSLRIYAPNWADVNRVRVYRNGEAVEDVRVPLAATPLRFERTFMLDAPAPCWFVVVVEGQRPLMPAYYTGRGTPTPIAVTNPWWVDKE